MHGTFRNFSPFFVTSRCFHDGKLEINGSLAVVWSGFSTAGTVAPWGVGLNTRCFHILNSELELNEFFNTALVLYETNGKRHTSNREGLLD